MAKTLILPAEILSREFDARLLQAMFALDRGWRVVVGSKALINRSIWRLPRGLYLCQTLTNSRLTMLKLLKKLGFVSFGWDEEGLIYLDRDVYLTRRVSSDTLNYLSALVSWGKEGAEDLDFRAIQAGLKARPLGNPRFDLMRKELRGLHADEVKNLRSRYGDFVLINSSFQSVNPIVNADNYAAKKTEQKDRVTPNVAQRYESLKGHRERLFKDFLTMPEKLSRRFPGMTVIVRPHPAEDIQVWQMAADSSSSFQVIREGTSAAWLLAARAVIHNACTTAVEAAVIGHTPVAYCPEVSVDDESVLPNNISYRATDLEALFDAVERATEGSLVMGADQTEIFARYVSGIEGPLATEHIMDMCDALHERNTKATTPIAVQVATRIFCAARHFYKSLRINHRTDVYIDKVFPTLSVSWVEDRANLIAQALGMEFQIDVRQIGNNIFYLDRVLLQK